jgi:hypothetical protein
MSILLGLGLGAKLLGFGGTSALGIGARLLGWDRKLLGVAKQISPKGWLAIGAALALIVGFFVHQHHARAVIARAKAEQKTADQDAFNRKMAQLAAKANQIRVQAEQLHAAITQRIRTRHDEEDRNIGSRGVALRMRGPGAALCGPINHSGVPAGAGGSLASGGSGNAAVDRVPYPEWSQLIGMPFDDATRFGEQHDRYRNEVAAWHEWYPSMVASWNKLRSSATSSPAKH